MKNSFNREVRPNSPNNFALHVRMLRNAGSVPKDLTDTQAQVILMRAMELGVAPTIALSEIRMRDAKTVVSFELLRSLVHRSGLLAYEERTDKPNESTVKLMHINGRVEQVTFSLAQAQADNLLEKKSWKTNESQMLYQRAYIKVVRNLFPEISLGIIIEDEYVETPGLLKKVFNFLLSFRTKKPKARILRVRFSELAEGQSTNNASNNASISQNTGVAKILAKNALKLSTCQTPENQSQAKTKTA